VLGFICIGLAADTPLLTPLQPLTSAEDHSYYWLERGTLGGEHLSATKSKQKPALNKRGFGRVAAPGTDCISIFLMILLHLALNDAETFAWNEPPGG